MVAGFLAMVGAVIVGSGSSYSAIWATPGISANSRLMPVGVLDGDGVPVAEAVFVVGAALPVMGNNAAAGGTVACPINEVASGAAKDIGRMVLFVEGSFA